MDVKLAIVLLLLAAPSFLWGQNPAPASRIRFEEIAQKAGVDYVTANSATPNKNQPETMVAGVALLDYDRDGYLDIFLVSGAEIPSLEKTSPKYWNRLYH